MSENMIEVIGELAKSMFDSHNNKVFLVDAATKSGEISEEKAKELKMQFQMELGMIGLIVTFNK